MALLRREIGRCKRCKKHGPMMFMNHTQAQEYCDICQPIIQAENIDKAICLLLSEGITKDMLVKLIETKTTEEG